jgi:LacI family transcriptional regulator
MTTSTGEEMVKRPTIMDLAAAAGVSVATVDRVLNRRLPVREDTVVRVVQAAEGIGFHATGLLRQRLVELPMRRFGFLLQRRNTFYKSLGVALDAASKSETRLQVKPIVEFIEDIDPAATVKRLRQLAVKAHALAVVAVDHPLVNDCINEIVAGGKPVFTIISDVSTPHRTAYLGVDKRKSGRTAAWFIDRMCQGEGKIGIMLGSHRYLSQEDTEIAFRSYLREHAPRINLLEPEPNLDDDDVSYQIVSDIMTRNSDLMGLFLAGGGQEGMVRAVRERGVGSALTIVCNELMPDTRTALIDGIVDMVLHTPLETISRKTVEIMGMATGAIDGRFEKLNLFPPDILTSANI